MQQMLVGWVWIPVGSHHQYNIHCKSSPMAHSAE